MRSIVIKGMGGRIPRLEDALLPDRAATRADNCKLFSGGVSSWFRGSETYEPLMTGIKGIYRIHNGAGSDFWLTFQTWVNVVREPGATNFGIFWTGEATPRRSNLALATSSPPYPTDHYEMGLPSPTAPTAVATTPGSGTPSSRTYIATYVDTLGNEGPPSLPSNSVTFNDTGFTIDLSALERGYKAVVGITRSGTTATANVPAHGFYDGAKATIAAAIEPDYNGTFVITYVDDDNFTYQVANNPTSPATGTITAAGNYNLDKMRIYRSLTGSTGVVSFQLVKERNITSTTDTDTVLDSALGAICPSFELGIVGSEWVQPPANMKWLVLHPGNFAVGIAGKQLCFSEPGRLWAWPERYRISLDYDGEGLGIVGNTVVVATTGKAYKASGNHPLYMSKDSDEGSEPCTSGEGVASLPFGVLYPTPNGIQLIGVGGTQNAMKPWARREEWRENYFPNTIFAAIYQDSYFGFYDDGSKKSGFIFDRANDGGELADLDVRATTIHTDEENRNLYYVVDDIIYEWEGDSLNRFSYDWESKEFTLPKEVNMSAAQIDADWEVLVGDFAAQAAQILIDQAESLVIYAVDPLASIPVRVDSTAYVAGDSVLDGVYHLVCTTGGTTDASPPSYAGKEIGDTVTDNTVTWTLSWQVQSAARGSLNSNQLNEFTLHGSLANDQFANYDNRTLTFKLYAWDYKTGMMALKSSKNVTGPRAFRLPGTYKSHLYKLGISGNIPVTAIKIADSMDELKRR